MATVQRSAHAQTSAKTSIQILEERNELSALLKRIEGEAEHALTHPEISFLVLCRVIALVRGVTRQSEPSPSSSEKISAPGLRSTSTSTLASGEREQPPSARLDGYGAGLVAEQQLQLPLLTVHLRAS
jgi:hypothetical protein